MNKYLLGFIAFIIIIALGIVLISSQGLFGKKAQATIGETKLSLDVADTPQKQEKGLSGRSNLGEKQGMVFLFDEPIVPSFWMKGMKFPIDIIFLNDTKVVTLYKNVPAPATTDTIPTTFYQPTSPSNRVIELKAGMADKYGINVGDSIDLSL